MTFYNNQRAAIATCHGKERAISRPMRLALGLNVVVPPNLDTDTLGTFSGEIPREGTPHEVCVRKARLGMAAAQLPLGIANEGSFGPHPVFPFIPAGIEIMTFVDDEHGIVITESLLSDRTNYGHREVRVVDELEHWLLDVGFPSHALIVRPKCCKTGTAIEKGVASLDRLKAAIVLAVATSDDGIAWVETDMRAHLNPMRMSAIRRLACQLARRVSTPCPACMAPGWGRTESVEGLPCELCGAPTEMILYELFTCLACGHREERPRRDGLQLASPQHCPGCNP